MPSTAQIIRAMKMMSLFRCGDAVPKASTSWCMVSLTFSGWFRPAMRNASLASSYETSLMRTLSSIGFASSYSRLLILPSAAIEQMMK